ASPTLTRVTFESSTDSVSYALLGNGTPVGNNWTLTGLSLPTGQNIYIRARGFYRSGFENNSESITASVRNVVLDAATPTPTPTSSPSPSPTPTPTPTPTPLNISGIITYCSNPALPPVPGATLTLTGDANDAVSSDSFGNYAL